MDKESRVNAAKIRKQKNIADTYIWDKVPPVALNHEERARERRYGPRREVAKRAECGHEEWDNGHCAEMSCHNYIGKHR